MKLEFHQKTIALLGIQPKFSSQINSSFLQVLTQKDLIIPGALYEWFSIEGGDQLFEQFCSPHDLASIADITYWMQTYPQNTIAKKMLPILFENQGVWHLGVPLGLSENPPVYIGFSEDTFDWRLHAQSFSDCVYAFAWDYSILQNEHRIEKIPTPEQNNWMETKEELVIKGPETRVSSVWFYSEKFIRYQAGCWRKTVMVNGQESTVIAAQMNV